jgi:uncharacterized protein (DUF1800 family)
VDQALRALNRFGLGARIGERSTLGGPRGWLLSQLDSGAASMQRPLPPAGRTPSEIARRLREAQRSGDPEAVRGARREMAALISAERAATLTRRVETDAPYLERLVAFWSNHLCVSVVGKPRVLPLAGSYEREAIRPHVLGRYADMVLASARHPAMLIYLDNVTSIGPASPASRRSARRGRPGRGLNENYARELMELHTLGVDGGYTQGDVEAVAGALTGWTLAAGPTASPDDRPYQFRPALHEPGTKTVLGRRYGEGGESEGEEIIRDLCEHPSTARFLATKLVRHFVSDTPPEAAVDRIAARYSETGGDLDAVARALVDLDEAWDPEAHKIRTPQDWLVAALRAVRAGEVPTMAPAVLQQLRHPLWGAEAPKGFGDGLRDWADPDGLMNRAELARSVGRQIARSGLEPSRLLEVVDSPDDDPIRRLAVDRSVSRAERVALVLGGPAFQWR